MGGGLEADLSQGAVPALWCGPPAPSAVDGWRPVLQVVDVKPVPPGFETPRRPVQYQQYTLQLSDGAYSQYASLDPALNHLVEGDHLRSGSVVRLLSYYHFRSLSKSKLKVFRTIIINKLEILQTECALIQGLEHYRLPRGNSGRW